MESDLASLVISNYFLYKGLARAHVLTQSLGRRLSDHSSAPRSHNFIARKINNWLPHTESSLTVRTTVDSSLTICLLPIFVY